MKKIGFVFSFLILLNCSTGYTNADFHGFETLIKTSLLDTISLSHIIDCTNF